LPVLDPLPIRGRGRPRGALGGVTRVAPTNTRRLPSAFERRGAPASTAPPAFNRPTERLYIVNSGLNRLDNGHEDQYEPGTQRERGYMRGLSSIYQTDSLVDAATATAEVVQSTLIEVELGEEELDEDVDMDVVQSTYRDN